MFTDFLRGLAAVPVAALPGRYWQRFPALPVEQRVLLSAVLTMLAGFAAGIPGFIAYAGRAGRIAADMTLAVAQQQNQGQLAPDPALNYAPFASMLFAPLAFALFTPLGLLSTYLVLSGLARVFGSVTLNPFGDPLLTGLDTLVRGTRTRTRARSARRHREREEGADVPDRLYEGAWADLPGVEYVVVSARRKPGWEPGTFIMTPDQWYTLGTPFDMRTPDGHLRTVYPLTAQTTNEVLRRGVHYELPPLRKARGKATG
jgi:hypothetical protein